MEPSRDWLRMDVNSLSSGTKEQSSGGTVTSAKFLDFFFNQEHKLNPCWDFLFLKRAKHNKGGMDGLGKSWSWTYRVSQQTANQLWNFFCIFLADHLGLSCSLALSVRTVEKGLSGLSGTHALQPLHNICMRNDAYTTLGKVTQCAGSP